MTYEYDVPPPGTFIQEELDARGWSQRDLAYILGISEQALNKIVLAKHGISSEMAKALGKAFDVNPEFFANLQNSYDMAKAREPDPAIERRARLQSVYPVREMIRRGWLQDTDAALLEVQMARFFVVANDNEIPHVAHAAKKTPTKYDEVPPAQLAWLFRVKQIGKSIYAAEYSPQKLRAAVEEMQRMRGEPEEVRHVPRLLEESGVRFIIVEGLPGGKIDGVCCWHGSSPIIGMSLRFDRIDNFWFVVRHECEHVLRGHGRDHDIIDLNLDGKTEDVSEEERQANEAAAEFCVPQDKMDSFMVRKGPYYSERDVLNFAKTMGVHPGLVVGQIQKRTDRYDFLKRHQVKIRHLISRVAIIDGWGTVAPADL